MSKLDYVTIAIVAICILAIVFFVYKMTDLFGDKPANENIESVTDPVETEDDTYDPATDAGEDLEGSEDEGTGGTADSDQENVPAESGTEDEEISAGDAEAEDDVATSDEELEPKESYGSTGKYMVLAGAFEKKANARSHAKRLRGMGYEHANVEIFDRGKFAVVLVDRFTSMSSAENLVTSLKKNGVSSYVKEKQ